jgi:hypothetical protein
MIVKIHIVASWAVTRCSSLVGGGPKLWKNILSRFSGVAIVGVILKLEAEYSTKTLVPTYQTTSSIYTDLLISITSYHKG